MSEEHLEIGFKVAMILMIISFYPFGFFKELIGIYKSREKFCDDPHQVSQKSLLKLSLKFEYWRINDI
jgi:hypothetical protein